MRALIAWLSAAVAALAVVPATAAAEPAPCTGDPTAVQRLDLEVGGGAAYGLYAFPAGPPRGLVVFGHGYTYNVDAWRRHIVRAARQDGLVAVAMNYRGLTDLPRDKTGFERSRGFPVKAGGEDLVAAGQHFDRACGGFERRFLLGVSMGGNSTGLAAAMRARSAADRPLFDYWVAIEAVYNFTETYLEARSTMATGPQEDIEKEAGGPIEQKPDAYRERTVLARAGDVAASGLKGIVMVHGQYDGLVPYNQAVEFARAIREQDVPTDFYTATRKAPGDQADDTRFPGAPADGPGHASEWARHVVIDTGMDRLSALARRDEPPPCNRDFTVDGTATPQASPDPSKPASGCPARPAFAGSPGGGGGAPGGGSGEPPVELCDDTRPRVSLQARRRGARGLRITGRTADRDCTGPSGDGLRRVRIAVSRTAGKRCRFVTRRTGRLSRPRSCTRQRIFLRPSGTPRRFRFSVRGLPRARYRVIAVATDAAGNRGRSTARARLR